MSSVSELAKLYEAVYHKPPSSHSMAALLAMEQMLGITADDLLGRMMIVLLHSSDRLDQTKQEIKTLLKDRTQYEKDALAEVRGLANELAGLSADLQKARFAIRRKRWEVGYVEYPGQVVVETYRKVSPMLSYLRCAFRLRTSVTGDNRVIGPARWDLLCLCATALIILLAGMVIGGAR